MRGWGVLVIIVYMYVLIGIKDIVNKYFCKKNDWYLIIVVNIWFFFMFCYKYNMYLKYKLYCFGVFWNSKE